MKQHGSPHPSRIILLFTMQTMQTSQTGRQFAEHQALHCKCESSSPCTPTRTPRDISPPDLLASTTHPCQVCLPPLLLVLLGSFHRIRGSIDAPAGNDKVCTTTNSRLGSLILLTELIALGRKIDTRREDDEILVLGRGHSGRNVRQRSGRDESQHKTLVFPCVVDRGRCVIPSSQ